MVKSKEIEIDNLNRNYAVTNFNFINDIHSLLYLSKEGIPAVQMRRSRVRNKPLSSLSVFSCGSHSNTSGFVSAGGKFRSDGIRFAAPTVTSWTTSLDNKIGS